MSTIMVDTIQDTSGNEQFTAKAWVNFNGTGTVAIRADGGVSSITDNGTGNYSVNFNSAFSSTSYAGPSASGDDGSSYIDRGGQILPLSTTSCRVFHTITANDSPRDVSTSLSAYFGDLA